MATAADEDVIVRAGEMRIGDFRKSVEVCHEMEGFYGLSFFSFPGMDAREIAIEVGAVREETGFRLMPNPSMRQSTAATVRALGYPLEADNSPRGHVTLRFVNAPTDDDWQALDGAFQRPEENPIAL
jgi:hypothetical protein